MSFISASGTWHMPTTSQGLNSAKVRDIFVSKLLKEVEVIQPKTVTTPVVTATPDKNQLLASLLTPQELYMIYALLGEARNNGTILGNEAYTQSRKLTDKVMNALSVVHLENGNLDNLRCLCHNLKLVGAKCPKEVVKLAS